MQITNKPLMKVVGHRKPLKVDVISFNDMQKTVNNLRAGRGLAPKGVYRFKTFAEADEWLTRMMAKNSLHVSQR